MADEQPNYQYDYDSDRVVDGAGNPIPDPPPVDEDRYLASMVRFLIEGGEKAEALTLLSCQLEASEEVWISDFSDREDGHTLVLRLSGPRKAYEALGKDDFMSILASVTAAAEALKPVRFHHLRLERGMALAGPQSADWRNELLAILEGRDVDNQAIGFKATQTWSGLRFRSQSEVRIAEALDKAGVMFFPNCKARLGSRGNRRNSEADFAVMLGGVWGVLEVDGPHHEGRAANDHERDRPFHFHGAAIVQRYEALKCYSDPDGIVLNFLALLKAKAK